MICEEITKKLNSLSQAGREFLAGFDDEKPNVKQLLVQKEKLYQEIHELKKEVCPEGFFIDFLENDQRIWNIIHNTIAELSNSEPGYDISLLYSELDVELKPFFREKELSRLTSLGYKIFLRNYSNSKRIQAMIASFPNTSKKSDIRVFLNSFFLNTFYKRGVIDVSDIEIPRKLQVFFGACLRGPNIKVDKLDSHAGYMMASGLLEAKKVEDYAGDYMNGGKMVIGEAGDYLGKTMAGGEILCRKCKNYAGVVIEDGKLTIGQAGDYLGAEMNGGKISAKECGVFAGKDMKNGVLSIGKSWGDLAKEATGGTIFVEETGKFFANIARGLDLLVAGDVSLMNLKSSTLLADGQINISGIDDSNHVYEFSGDQFIESLYFDPYADVDRSYKVETRSSLDEFFAKKAGLAVIDANNPEFQDRPVGLGLTGGILICRGIPQQGFGAGGGILIIEDDSADPEEVKKLMAEGRKVGDGLLLMRIPDGNGGHRYIDLEE